MHEHVSSLTTSNLKLDTSRRLSANRACRTRNALFVAGASAFTYGLWKRGRLGWPVLLGGGFLLYEGARRTIPRESSCEVSQTINRSPDEVYSYLRDFQNWPLFMKGMSSVQPGASGKFAWQLSGTSREGCGVLIEEQPGSALSWEADADGQCQQASVRLRPAPGNRGTEVHWGVSTSTPGNLIGLLKKTTGASPEQQTRESLRALKQLLEAGEVPTINGQPHGARGLKGRSERVIFRETPDEKRRPARETGLPNEELAAS